MITGKLNVKQPRDKTFAMTGGLNQQVGNKELKPGELVDVLNYHEREGKYTGYQSVKGYERYDGQTKPSSIGLDGYSDWADSTAYVLNDRVEYNSHVFKCILAHTGDGALTNAPDSGTPGDNTWWEWEAATADADLQKDYKREAARTAIAAVTGDGATCSGVVRGVHLYNDLVYAWRDEQDGTECAFYESSASGWSLIDNTSMTEVAGSIKAVNGRFSLYNSNDEVMLWVDGVNQGFFVYNGTSVTHVTDTNLGTSAPTDIGVFQNRLFLVFPKGHILFSEVGDPTAWDSSTGNAGEIYLGDTVTDIATVGGGKLAMFTRSKIKMLTYGSTTDQFIFKLDDFSDNMGAIDSSVQSLLGTLYFADDRGISSLGPAPNWDGLITKLIGKKVDILFQANKANITGSAVDRGENRYYLFYNSGGGSHILICTFDNTKLKGITKQEITADRATCVTTGTFTDGTNKIFFGGADGFVYEMNIGTSFDGAAIPTRFSTAYYNYGTTRNYKHFQRLDFEIDCETGTSYTIGKGFDYGTTDLAKPAQSTKSVSGGGLAWGSGILWGSFIWGSGALGVCVDYIHGYGTNMNITVRTEEEWKSQHTIHNVTVDYLMAGRKQ